MVALSELSSSILELDCIYLRIQLGFLLSVILHELVFQMHHGSSYLEHLNFLSAIRAKGEKAPAVDRQEGLISVAIELQPSFLLRACLVVW